MFYCSTRFKNDPVTPGPTGYIECVGNRFSVLFICRVCVPPPPASLRLPLTMEAEGGREMLLRAQLENVQVTIRLFRVQYNVQKQVYSPYSTASQGLGAMTGTVAIAAFRESLDSAWSTILPPRYASYLQQTQK